MRQVRFVTAAGQPCLLSFNRTDPGAVAWARKQSARLVTQVTAETRAAIRAIVSRAFADGIPARQAARLIHDIVGLHTTQATAVANLRQELIDAGVRADRLGRPVTVHYGQHIERVVGAPAGPGRTITRMSQVRVPPGGLSIERLSDLTKRYAARLRKQRALLISRTESISAANSGQQLMWKQNVDAGLLRGTEMQRWSVAHDERLCPICIELDGQTVPMGGVFTSSIVGELTGPTAHVNCRCSVVLVV